MKTRAASHVTGFLEALASERGASLNTIDAYRRDLADYEAYLAAKGMDALKADPSCVRGFLAARGAQSLSAASLARRLSAIRQFHKFLYAEGWRRDDPTLGRRGPTPVAPAAQAPEHGGGRAPDRDRARGARRHGAPIARTAGSGAHRLPDRTHLRLGPQGVGSAEPQEVGGDDQGAAHRRRRQGRQGAPRAALRARPRRDDACFAPCSIKPRPARLRAHGSFPPRARAAT